MFIRKILIKDERKLLIAMQLASAVLLCCDSFAWGYRGSAGEQRYRKRNRSGNYPSTEIDCEKKKSLINQKLYDKMSIQKALSYGFFDFYHRRITL